MYYLFFLGGVVFGSIITQILVRYKTGAGYFRLDPASEDDPEDYLINIRISNGQNLLDKRKIILKRDFSQR